MHNENSTAARIARVRSIARKDMVSAIQLAHSEWKLADVAARAQFCTRQERKDAESWRVLRQDLKSKATARDWDQALGAFTR